MSMRKYEIVKKILAVDQRYDVDYLMRWRFVDLENFYKRIKRKIEKEKEEEKGGKE